MVFHGILGKGKLARQFRIDQQEQKLDLIAFCFGKSAQSAPDSSDAGVGRQHLKHYDFWFVHRTSGLFCKKVVEEGLEEVLGLAQ
jgi:hypothetical protein